MDDAFIKDALLKGHYISAEQVKDAEAFAKSHHVPFTDYLFEQELLSKDLLGQAAAEALGVEYLDLKANAPAEAAAKLPADFARTRRAVLVAEGKGGPVIATDAHDIAALKKDAATLFPGKKVEVRYSLPEHLDEALAAYADKLEARFTKILQKGQTVAPEIVAQIFEDAVRMKASDIHLEPQESEAVVRFRIDGVLTDVGVLPKPQYEAVVNRLKIEARLRIDEHNKAQDGAIRYHKGELSADLRVSIIPTVSGEKVVLRLLGEYLRTLSLSELGLTEAYQKRLTEMAMRPYGMILTVGPTGSGKTTTLYALLRMLNDTSVNIMTVEDPVEYRIPRVNQVQVNEATGLSFSTGLRTIVRQDPDVILVGEIRDLETAEMAVNASLTGHLLLSSFHANDASTVIPRLLDMKVEPFLLASTLMVIVAQRLVRKTCPQCKTSETIPVASLANQYPKLAPFLTGDEVTLYKPKGCAHCGGSGYRGQIGIYEFVEISPAIQELALHNPSSLQIAEIARREGALSLFEDGLQKVLEGITTVEELLRVALPPNLPAAKPRATRKKPAA